MPRVKRGTTANKRRKNLLKHAKGFKWGRNTKYRLAKDALIHAWSNAFVGRKLKKRDARADWQVQIGAEAKKNGLSYSKFIGQLKKSNIILNRKILAQLAQEYPQAFNKIIETSAK